MLFRRSPQWDSLTYWALDLETGGLNPSLDPILSVAMVPIREQRVRLGEAFATLVRPPAGALISAGSVRVHQLVPAELAGARPEAEVLPEIERRLEGAVLLVHHAAIDVAFLRDAFRAARRRWPEPPVVDTAALLLSLARRERRHNPELPGDPPPLQLAAARRGHGLPSYPEHDALVDALATAELFLVLREALGARTLRDLR